MIKYWAGGARGGKEMVVIVVKCNDGKTEIRIEFTLHSLHGACSFGTQYTLGYVYKQSNSKIIVFKIQYIYIYYAPTIILIHVSIYMYYS